MTETSRPDAHLHAMASLATPMAIRVAATLRLADHLSIRPMTSCDLAAELRVNEDALDRVMRHLCSIGVLSRGVSSTYLLTAAGESLRDDHPSQLRAKLDVNGAEGLADLCLVHLPHTVRSGEAAFPLQYGATFWEYLSTHTSLAESFHCRMANAVADIADDITGSLDWGALGHVVDVGGGTGTLLIALLRRYPNLRGTVVDLPPVAEAARAALVDAGVGDRASFAAGSFFERLPPHAAGYLLSAIIHNWDDGSAVHVLRRCADAAGPEGRIFVIEKVRSDGVGPNTETDLRMMAYFAARERDVSEIARLATAASLDVLGVHAAGTAAVIELASAR